MWLRKLNYKSTKLGSAAIHSAASFESSREETALNHCAEKHSLLGVAAFFAMNSTRASTQIDANMDSYSWHAADSTPLEGLLFVTLYKLGDCLKCEILGNPQIYGSTDYWILVLP